jgi:hypothetical protein
MPHLLHWFSPPEVVLANGNYDFPSGELKDSVTKSRMILKRGIEEIVVPFTRLAANFMDSTLAFLPGA